jgi:hypothetical protein
VVVIANVECGPLVVSVDMAANVAVFGAGLELDRSSDELRKGQTRRSGAFHFLEESALSG